MLLAHTVSDTSARTQSSAPGGLAGACLLQTGPNLPMALFPVTQRTMMTVPGGGSNGLLLSRFQSKEPLRQNTEGVGQGQKHLASSLLFRSRVLPRVFTLEVITKGREEGRRGAQTPQASKAWLTT